MEKIDWALDRDRISVYEPHEGPAGKPKSAYRLRYSAEVAVLKKTYGDLEQIRQNLGFSRRKICQLLMVDPSAWTRWTRGEAPPHIYKTLALMLQMQEEKKGFIDPVLKEQVQRLEVQVGLLSGQLEAAKPKRSIWPTVSVVISLMALALSIYLGFYATSVILDLSK